MAWRIANIDNTVKVSAKVAKEIYKATMYERDNEEDDWEDNEYYHNVDDVTYKGKLSFNPEHMEHGDYINLYGNDAHALIPSELWTHVGIVLGREILIT